MNDTTTYETRAALVERLYDDPSRVSPTEMHRAADLIEADGNRLALAEKTIEDLHNRIGGEMIFSVLRSELLGDLEAYEAAKETL